jgi:hypothetical protein
MSPTALTILATRAEAAGLSNVSTWRGMIEDYPAPFRVALALHACGNATDHSLLLAERHRAAYVVSPCCVGALPPHPSLLAFLHHPVGVRGCSPGWLVGAAGLLAVRHAVRPCVAWHDRLGWGEQVLALLRRACAPACLEREGVLLAGVHAACMLHTVIRPHPLHGSILHSTCARRAPTPRCSRQLLLPSRLCAAWAPHAPPLLPPLTGAPPLHVLQAS